MRYVFIFFAALSSVGCSTIQKVEPKPMAVTTHLRPLEYKDQFLVVAPHYFQETPQSRAVVAGSKFYANSNYCEFIRRYKLKTNVDFNSAINLFKYRAFLMGASRVVFVDSSASNGQEKTDAEIILHPSMSKDDSSLSLVVGDLYECPNRLSSLY
jgi:hypothetical protein